MAERSVIPGESLGTEEEYAAGAGTFVDRDGEIRALIPGRICVSPGKAVSVQPVSPVPVALKRGDVVLARVEEIFEPVALLQVAPTTTGCVRQGPSDGYGVIHASRIKSGYVDLVHDELRIGDIVKAVVEEVRPADGELSLSTKYPGMGVVKAYCSRCRNPLVPAGGRLQCERCGSVERRHLSSSYSVAAGRRRGS